MSEPTIHGTMNVPVTDELIAALEYVNSRELLPPSVAIDIIALLAAAKAIRVRAQRVAA